MFFFTKNDKINKESSDKMRDTYALINLKNLKENIQEIKEKYNNYKYYIGVVKANAYGHGNYLVKALEQSGINYLAVSSLEEAIDVRKYTNLPILCFGYVNLKDIDIVIKQDITLSIISYEYFKELIEINPKIKVHLKINTGMNRFGVKSEEQVLEIVKKLEKSNMELEGIYTHLATSGVSDTYYDYQIEQFKKITSKIDLNKIKIVHLFNSLALTRHKKLSFANGVRLGLIMYGFSYSVGELKFLAKLKRKFKLKGKKISSTTLTNDLKLKKVLSLHSEVVNINKIEKNEFVGYNAKFIAHKKCYIATISIGHADGITDSYKKVKINNITYPIIGICMDYIMVLVDEKVKIHDKVTLIGEGITVGMIATPNDTPHHVLVSITDRVKRKYEE